MFKDFANAYFDYMAKSFFHYYPTCLAKILGAFKVKIFNRSRNTAAHHYMFVMENLNIGVNEGSVVRYDLKGSRRNRYVNTINKRSVRYFIANPVATLMLRTWTRTQGKPYHHAIRCFWTTTS